MPEPSVPVPHPPVSSSFAAPRVLAIANQKGGVGKTTTAINLGTALSAIGQRVLLVDADPQGNASTGLGISRSMRRKTLYDVVMETLPINGFWLMTNRIGLTGSVWFTTGEGEEMAAMAAAKCGSGRHDRRRRSRSGGRSRWTLGSRFFCSRCCW